MMQLIHAFNEYVKENEKEAIDAFKELQRITEEENVLHINNKIPMFPRPGLIHQKDLSKVATDAEKILKIITTIPERIFNNDIKQMCSYLGLSSQHYQLIKQTYGDNEGMMSRCDLFFEGEDSYKFLEFNVDSSVGGIEIAAVNKVMEEMEFYKKWGINQDWKYDDPLKNFVKVINKVTENKLNKETVTVAVIDWHTYIDGYIWSLNLIKEYLMMQGFNVIVCSQREVELVDGHLSYQGQKIDVVYRVFLSDDALEHPEELDPILEAYKQNNLILLSGVHTELYSNKAIFALLSDPHYYNFYSEEEKEVINRCIPWTRILANRKTDYAGQEIDLLNFIINNKDRFVIKPALGYGGQSVVLGWNSTKEVWKKAISDSIHSDVKYIVQEKVNSVEEDMPKIDKNGVCFEKVLMNWGIYVFDGRYSGSMLRGLTKKDHGIINAAQGASMTCVFYKE